MSKEEQLQKGSKTDWQRVRAMEDKDIDLAADSPELDTTFFAEAVPWPPKKNGANSC